MRDIGKEFERIEHAAAHMIDQHPDCRSVVVQAWRIDNVVSLRIELLGAQVKTCEGGTDIAIGYLKPLIVAEPTFAPHTTQIFQVLDTTLFGVLKRQRRYELPFGDEKATVQFFMKVYHNFKQTMVEPNIWGAFQALGFEFDTRSEPYRLLFNEEKLRESTGFRELWSIDFPLDQLSVRRRNTKFG
jgi:hypothetical protein